MGEEVNSTKADDEDDLSYLFTCDTNPSHIADDLDIPAYSSKFKVLKHKEEKEEVVQKPRRPGGPTCWNCGASHNLRDCPKPRDHALIAQNRLECQARFTKVRYHTDEEQKYPHLQPGKISDRLREALGLRADQAPPFIYRMRELGYPPGWVEEAKVSHSGLTMFVSNGQEAKDPDLEDGEIMSNIDRDKYDFRKLIEYPGFNVPFEEGTTDETDLLRVCPMREGQSIKHMQKLWSAKKSGSYRRKRMTMKSGSEESHSASNQNISQEEEEMELDAEQEEVKFLPATDACGFIPPLPVDSPARPPLPQTPSSPADAPKSAQAPTSEQVPHSEPSPAKGVKRKLSEAEDEASPGTEESSESAEKKNRQSAETYNGRVKSVCSGTPVITRSEFKYLPSPENFSKNICDVINFENLPNATGKYDQMHGLIKKVRNYVTESLLKADEDDDDE